jgi:hypothetical protein
MPSRVNQRLRMTRLLSGFLGRVLPASPAAWLVILGVVGQCRSFPFVPSLDLKKPCITPPNQDVRESTCVASHCQLARTNATGTIFLSTPDNEHFGNGAENDRKTVLGLSGPLSKAFIRVENKRE